MKLHQIKLCKEWIKINMCKHTYADKEIRYVFTHYAYAEMVSRFYNTNINPINFALAAKDLYYYFIQEGDRYYFNMMFKETRSPNERYQYRRTM